MAHRDTRRDKKERPAGSNRSEFGRWFEITQLAQNSTRPLDALDIRMFAAMIKKNKLTGVSSLWTAHNIGVNSSGVAGVTAADRKVHVYRGIETKIDKAPAP